MQNTEKSATKTQDPAGDSLSAIITRAVQLGIAEALATTSLAAPPPPDPDKLLTLDEAADLLNVSRPQIDRLVRLYSMPYCRVGEVKRVHRASLLAWASTSQAVEAA